ncbi:MAG: hypothetical protein C4327_06265 [Meiothermus sp.]
MQALPHPAVPAWASSGAVLRAKALQGYLAELEGALKTHQAIPPVTVMVLGEADWRARTRHPYGFPFQRTSLKEGLYLFIPARYPERFVWRLREVFMPATRRVGKLPGRVEHFLDLNLGHEYAHAVQVAWGLRTRVRWVDEFVANYLYLWALHKARPELYGQALAWGALVAGLAPQEPSLGSYDRKPHSLSDQLWFQGQFTTQAARLVESGGSQLLSGLLQAAPLKRSTVHKVLVGLEPSLREWFAGFAPKRRAERITWENLG